MNVEKSVLLEKYLELDGGIKKSSRSTSGTKTKTKKIPKEKASPKKVPRSKSTKKTKPKNDSKPSTTTGDHFPLIEYKSNPVFNYRYFNLIPSGKQYYFIYEYLLNINQDNYPNLYQVEDLMETELPMFFKLYGFNFNSENQYMYTNNGYRMNYNRAEEILVRVLIRSRNLDSDLFLLKKIQTFEKTGINIVVFRWLIQTYKFGCSTLYEFATLYRIVLEYLNEYDKTTLFLYYNQRERRIYMINLFWKFNMLFGTLNSFSIGPDQKLIKWLIYNQGYFKTYIDNCCTEINLVSPGSITDYYVNNIIRNSIKPSSYYI